MGAEISASEEKVVPVVFVANARTFTVWLGLLKLMFAENSPAPSAGPNSTQSSLSSGFVEVE
jgi:hypothetical protein